MSTYIFNRECVSRCTGEYERPGHCDNCDRELVASGDQQRHCDAACRKAIQTLPLDVRSVRREAVPLGLCVNCGASIPGRYRCPRARRGEAVRRWRRAAGGQLRFGAEAREWLAAKLRLDAEDERLSAIALKLAHRGRLTVLIDRDGNVVGMAKPRTKEEDAR